MNQELPLEISVAETKRLLDAEAIVLLDCRHPEEFQLASITSSMLFPMPELPMRVGELIAFREARIVVHCHHGMRSYQVAEWLRGQGFTQAQSMAGGIDAWSQSIDPNVPRYG